MSISEEILEAARKILGDGADVYIEREDSAATTLAAIAKQTGYTDLKTIVHGLGYLTDTRIWANNFRNKITVPSPQN